MHYRRDRPPGGIYFFTLATQDRRPLFADAENVARLRAAFTKIKTTHSFQINAIVVLPDHLHCLWTLPEGDNDFPRRWNQIKGAFTRALPEAGKPPRGISERRERAVWQRRYWEHRIRDEADFGRHCDYIHWNPVKHGLAIHPGDWPHSSFARFVAAGFYPADWGIACPDGLDLETGE